MWVLVTEDIEPLIASYKFDNKNILNKYGINIVYATTYQEALDAIDKEKEPPAIILSDFQFPGDEQGNEDTSGGIDLFVYSKLHLPNVPFIYLSSNDHAHIQKKLKERDINLTIDAGHVLLKGERLLEVMNKIAEMGLLSIPRHPEPKTNSNGDNPTV